MNTNSVSIVSFSSRGYLVATQIASIFNQVDSVVRIASGTQPNLKEWTKQAWATSDALIFVSSCGIAVRAIAPHVQAKTKDPAVICVDETSHFVISLLSGHIGGANRLSSLISEFLHATAVITTATDRNELFSVDDWATRNNYVIRNPEAIKHFSADLVDGQDVGFVSGLPFKGPFPDHVRFGVLSTESGVYFGYRKRDLFDHTLNISPKGLNIGVGLRRGADYKHFSDAVFTTLEENSLDIASVSKLSSIDLKADEPALLEFSENFSIPVETFNADQLKQVQYEGLHTSAFVHKTTGVDNVCERSALYGAGGDSKLLSKRQVFDHEVTIAIARTKGEYAIEY